MEKFRFGIMKLNYELYAQLNSLIVIGDLIGRIASSRSNQSLQSSVPDIT